MRARLVTALLAATAAALGGAAPAAAQAGCDRTYNGSVGADWGQALNWSPSGVPTAGEDVCVPDVAGIDAVTVNGSYEVASVTGTETLKITGGGLRVAGGDLAALVLEGGALQVDGPLALTDLTQGGGHLHGAGTVDVEGTFTWSGGEQSGLATTNVFGILALSGSPYLHDRTLHVVGDGTWSGTTSRPVMTGTATLLVSGTLDATAGSASYLEDYRYGYWTNAPVVRIAPGGTITRSVPGEIGSRIPVDVDGTLAPADGEVTLNGGLRGVAGADPGSTGALGGTGLVTVAGGAGVIAAGATVPGALRFTNGTTTVAGAVTGPATGFLEVAGGTLTGPGDIELAGELKLSGGDHTGTGTSTAQTLSLTGAPMVYDRTVRVTGTGAWTGVTSRPIIKGEATLQIEGTMDFAATDASYFDNYRYGWWDPDDAQVRVAPGGTVTRSTGGEIGSYVPFDVDGALAPQQGQINLNAGLRGAAAGGDQGSTGAFGSTGLVNVAGGSGVIAAGATVPGALKFTNGTTTVTGAVTGPPSGFLEVAGGTLTGPGDIDLAGELKLSGGDHTGTGTTTAQTLSLTGAPMVYDRTVRVTGTGAWTGVTSRPIIKGEATLQIEGTMDFAATDASYFDNYRYGWWDPDDAQVRVVPGGTVTRSVGGEIGSYVPFDVDGALAPAAGQINLNAGLRPAAPGGDAGSTGAFGGAGLVNIAGGSGTIADGATVAGALRVTNGTTTVTGAVTGAASGTLEIAGGTLTGPGDIDLAGELKFTGGDHTGTGTTTVKTLSLTGAPMLYDRRLRATEGGAWTGVTSRPVIKGEAVLEIGGTFDFAATDSSYLDTYRYGWWDPDDSKVLIGPDAVVTRSVPDEVSSYVPIEVDGTLAPGADATIALRAGSSGVSSGTFGGAGTIALAGGTFVAGDAAITGRTVVQQPLRLEGAVAVAPGGTLRQQSDLTGPGLLRVDGTLELAGGTHGGSGLTRIEPDGVLDFTAPVAIDHRSVRNRGTARFSGTDYKTVSLNGDARFENKGLLVLDNTHPSAYWSAGTTADGTPVVINQGRTEVTRPPGVQLYVAAPFENDGELALLGGEARIDAYKQTPDGVLEARLGPDAATTGSLYVGGTDAHLAGTLRLSAAPGYEPAAGTSWKVLTRWNTGIGTFAHTAGAGAFPGLVLDVGQQNGGTEFVVTSAAAPAPPAAEKEPVHPAAVAEDPAEEPAPVGVVDGTVEQPTAERPAAIAPRTLRVRGGEVLQRRLVPRPVRDARVRVLRRSRAARRVVVRRDGRLRYRAPLAAVSRRLWLDVVVEEAAGQRSQPARVRIVVR